MILPVVICQAKVITAGYFSLEPCAVHVLKRADLAACQRLHKSAETGWERQMPNEESERRRRRADKEARLRFCCCTKVFCVKCWG